MARIVFNTFGSFGDIHPYLAIALEVKKRGHTPVIATSEVYRAKVEGDGLEFASVRPDVGELLGSEELLKRLWHPRKGPDFLVRDYLLPQVEASYKDLDRACTGADLLITHAVGYAGPVVAEKRKLRWLSTALQPSVFLSAYDPPLLAPAPWLRNLRVFGPQPMRLILAAARKILARYGKPLQDLRQRLKLAPSVNPLLELSPYGTLALFSHHFAAPQPDWPPGVRICGFPFYDKMGQMAGAPAMESEALTRFLNSGPPPVLFTLGSAAVMQPGSFFEESQKAITHLRLRAVLLVGGLNGEALQTPDIHVASYAAYSEIMPECAAVVHQGGIGTTAQALRAGNPMVVVPWGYDQPDNADRIERLGVGRVLNRSRYTAAHVARELTSLLENSDYRERASLLQIKIASEDGATAASEAIESLLRQ